MALVGVVMAASCLNPMNGSDPNATPATYTITYDANGPDSGTAPSEQTKTAGVDLTLSDNSGRLAKTGHTFFGWNTPDDGSGDYAIVGAHFDDDNGSESGSAYIRYVAP